jgi:DNA-binding CsgD family transcriptional regulator
MTSISKLEAESTKKKRKPRFWTYYRCKILKEGYGKVPVAELSARLKTSESAIRNQAGKQGLVIRTGPQHVWTDQERAIIRRDYRGTKASAREIGQRLGVSEHAVKGQIQKMGIAMHKSPNWTQKEITLLKELVHHKSVGQIAKILRRSDNAVKVKAVRLQLRLRSRDGWYTKQEVCEICGVDHKKVQRWIDSGTLKARWHDAKPGKSGMAPWHIEERDLRDFLLAHCGELLGRNVDIQQIVWIVSEVKYLPGRRLNAAKSDYRDERFRAHLSHGRSALQHTPI